MTHTSPKRGESCNDLDRYYKFFNLKRQIKYHFPICFYFPFYLLCKKIPFFVICKKPLNFLDIISDLDLCAFLRIIFIILEDLFSSNFQPHTHTTYTHTHTHTHTISHTLSLSFHPFLSLPFHQCTPTFPPRTITFSLLCN